MQAAAGTAVWRGKGKRAVALGAETVLGVTVWVAAPGRGRPHP